MELKQTYRLFRNYYRDVKDSYGSKIKFYNYQWKSRNPEDHWISQFIIKRGLIKKDFKDSIGVFSVNGDTQRILNFEKSKYKIFYTPENVHVPYSYWENSKDLFIENDKIDLSLGFDYITNPKYLRFPYWLMSMFPPDADYNTIKLICDRLNKPEIYNTNRKEFCAFICRDDYFGDRIKMLNQINTITEVHCAGDFMHNNDDLKLKFEDNKSKYLEKYKFNLCPENSNDEGYVTEKIFEAIYSGCIPIYWGSNNNPEPDILNKDAIIFIQNHEDNTEALKLISKLNNSEELYLKFAGKRRLNNDAAKVIHNYFISLENKIKQMIN